MFECPLAWKPWRDRPSCWIGDSTIEVCDGPWHPHGTSSFTTTLEMTNIHCNATARRCPTGARHSCRQAGNKCIDEALDALGHRVAWRPDRRHVVEMTKP